MTAAALLGEPRPVAAVVIDLDDTLYPQRAWLDGALDEVARHGASEGLDEARFRRALARALEKGSDTGHLIDVALEACGAGGLDVTGFVRTFRSHAPELLPTYAGVGESLASLSRLVPIALVTDGEPACQRAKLDATGTRSHLSAVVFSDELGREHRKPDPAPFVLALEALGVAAGDAVFVGDRPDKDVEGANRAGMRAVRVRTGEYARCEDHHATWGVADSFSDAARLLAPLIERRS